MGKNGASEDGVGGGGKHWGERGGRGGAGSSAGAGWRISGFREMCCGRNDRTQALLREAAMSTGSEAAGPADRASAVHGRRSVSRTPRDGAFVAFAEVMRQRSPERLWLVPGERGGGEAAAAGAREVDRRLADPEDPGPIVDRRVAPTRRAQEDSVDRAPEDSVPFRGR